jgi:hypothetical protein
VMRAAAVVAGRAMSGIVSVLPPPESGEHPVRGDAG